MLIARDHGPNGPPLLSTSLCYPNGELVDQPATPANQAAASKRQERSGRWSSVPTGGDSQIQGNPLRKAARFIRFTATARNAQDPPPGAP